MGRILYKCPGLLPVKNECQFEEKKKMDLSEEFCDFCEIFTCVILAVFIFNFLKKYLAETSTHPEPFVFKLAP